MSAEQNKALVRRAFEEAWNKGNLAVEDEVVAEDFVHHGPTHREGLHGREEEKQSVAAIHSAFPDIYTTIEDQIAEGDKVVTRWTARGTHKGGFMGIAPTDKEVTVTGITINRIIEGKIMEEWVSWDTFGVLQQLEAVSLP